MFGELTMRDRLYLKMLDEDEEKFVELLDKVRSRRCMMLLLYPQIIINSWDENGELKQDRYAIDAPFEKVRHVKIAERRPDGNILTMMDLSNVKMEDYFTEKEILTIRLVE